MDAIGNSSTAGLSSTQASFSQAKLYHDFQGLKQLKHAGGSDDAGIKQQANAEVASQFESFFLQMMLKSMRQATASIAGDSMLSTDQTAFYESMFDQQVSTSLAGQSQLGLKDNILKQLAVVDAYQQSQSNQKAP